ncbi:MAG: YfjI family protein [Burkholderiales bacterium]
MKIIDVPQSLLQFVQQQHDDAAEWPAPEEVARPLLPVPSLRPNLLPPLLRRRAYDIAYRMQCPVDFIAAPLLVALGSIIGSRCAIRPKQRDPWTVYPNIWGAVLAAPGQLKTPAVNEALRIFQNLELRAQVEYEAANVQYVGEQVAREHGIKILKEQAQHALKKTGVGDVAGHFSNPVYKQIAEFQAQGKPPTLKRYRTNDATVEKLAELCVENPQGLLVMRDELVGLLAACVKEGKEGDRAFYLESWNGHMPFRQDRIGRGSIAVERLSLSLFGNIQPARLQQFMFGMDGLQNDGLLQRFQVMVYPDQPAHRVLVDEYPDCAAEDALDALVESLAYMDFQAMGASPPEGRNAPYFRFDAVAQEQFYKWYQALDMKIAAEDSQLMAEHLSKYRKLVPSLALIFHLVEVAERGKAVAAIHAVSLARATRWADYLEAHARRIFGQAADYRLLAARALQQKIVAGKLVSGFSERDVYRAGWSQLDGPEIVHEACMELVAAGWLRVIQVQRVTKPGSPKYEINPAVSGQVRA